jgi:hypothetical protein
MTRRQDDELADLLPALKDRLRAEGDLRGRLRSLPTPWRGVIVAALVASIAAAVAVLAPRGDLAVHPVPRIAAIAGVLFLAVVLIARVVLRPLSVPAPPGTLPPLLIAVVLLLPLGAALLPSPYDHPPAVSVGAPFPEPSFWATVAYCLFVGTVTGAPVLLLLSLLDRRDAPGTGRRLLAAGAAGLAGTLALLFHCPLVDRTHLVLGHAVVPVVLMAGALLLALRRRPT